MGKMYLPTNPDELVCDRCSKTWRPRWVPWEVGVFFMICLVWRDVGM